MRDVTSHWQAYQPATTFCIRPETDEYTPGGIGRTVTGANGACRHSDFPSGARGLVVIHVRTPTLCPEAHGGIGFTWEADVHWLFKRAQVDSLLLGGAKRHRATLARLAAAKVAPPRV